MDTSAEYIKMCDHPLVKNGHAYTRGEFYYDSDLKEVKCASFGHAMPCIVDVWLPRQDQIQEMSFNGEGLQTICYQIKDFSTGPGMEITVNGTMEQLWLAFYMYEKYNKTWDGENWTDK